MCESFWLQILLFSFISQAKLNLSKERASVDVSRTSPWPSHSIWRHISGCLCPSSAAVHHLHPPLGFGTKTLGETTSSFSKSLRGFALLSQVKKLLKLLSEGYKVYKFVDAWAKANVLRCPFVCLGEKHLRIDRKSGWNCLIIIFTDLFQATAMFSKISFKDS